MGSKAIRWGPGGGGCFTEQDNAMDARRKLKEIRKTAGDWME